MTICSRCHNLCEKVRNKSASKAVCIKCKKQRSRDLYIIKRTIKEQQIKLLCEGMGWVDLGKQKNPYMMSFIPDESSTIRMNIYFTTMTVTVQKRNRFCETYRNVGMEELENLLKENINDE